MSETRLATTWFDSQYIKDTRKKAQAYSSKEDLWSWYVLRRVSIFVSLLLIKLKVTPNAISWASSFFVVFSGFWLIQASSLSFILAFFSYNLGYLLDCVDGEVARLTGNESRKGYFIDLLIQGATLPVYLSILLATLNIIGLLTGDFWALAIIYIVVCAIISALFVPIAYQLTMLKQQMKNNVQDPVNKIRQKKFVFEVIGFILGLPGFFLTTLILTLASIVTNYTVELYYFLVFLAIIVFKTSARFLITVKSF
ncbi:CDP-alcohol phosphatidyltransferase family protein [Shouchella clausii]|uniref:CDP-alcohol phosphatidyltransferase family protein n=1 Tax=Shouchella clausii TaxID=79880 RepID=UPI0026F4CF00|nr:CDP-alcohol phosphatidyltransferase family protein [Shouchella clausii]MDO7269920.1 CDP-alcohol phosphatidyltransferase family protein [Shouchella clausii]MDO7287011.1 CDP-alcohol phosphatidyltransferase family protein [Shouchella clausii]